MGNAGTRQGGSGTGTRAPKTGQLARTRAAAIDATARLLLEEGFGALRIEKVAAESGVSRASLYRHFGDMNELAMEAFEVILGPPPPAPDTGDLREDLITNFKRLARALRRSEWGRVVPALVEASLRDQEFAKLLRRATRRRRDVTVEILEAAVDRGELPADTNFEWMLDKITGPIYYRLLFTGARFDEPGYIEHLVDSAIAAANDA